MINEMKAQQGKGVGGGLMDRRPDLFNNRQYANSGGK
jgi:hypothetical protein